MFNVEDQASIILDGKKVVGEIVGIDSYSMETFDDKTVTWTSYTLVTGQKGFLSRCWLVDRGRNGWFLSTGTKKKKVPTGATLVLERSGLTKIDFSGDKGISAPISALVVYRLKGNKYFGIERFSGSEVYAFESRKLQKPKIKKS